MFEWLDEELATIRTKRFHIVDGPASDKLRNALLESPLPAPPSYAAFVLRFGNSKLFRMKGLDSHWIRVLAAPRVLGTPAGEPLLHIAIFDETRAYLREDTLRRGVEAPVFESTKARVRKAADSFDEWLTTRATRARKRYTREEWAEVLRGPPPFTADELAIVAARRKFAWRVVGVTPNGEVLYEVTNGSDRRLPFLSIGIRSKTGHLHGGAKLPVAHIAPGQTAVVARDTYRGLLDPHDVEAHPLPDPEPEERSRYWEFREATTQ